MLKNQFALPKKITYISSALVIRLKFLVADHLAIEEKIGCGVSPS